MPKVECEECGKDVFGHVAFQILVGQVAVEGNAAVFAGAVLAPDEIKGDGFFCSSRCLQNWLETRNELRTPKKAR
jgi:hypothetical protein